MNKYKTEKKKTLGFMDTIFNKTGMKNSKESSLF